MAGDKRGTGLSGDGKNENFEGKCINKVLPMPSK